MQKNMVVTSSQEDYLESIYLILREKKFARIKDIAKARGVSNSSVTIAMKRLAEKDFIVYEKGEYIDLTDEGLKIARSILARHDILKRFFSEVLQMDEENSEADACAMEHHLSDTGMDKLARFFEFLHRYPGETDRLLDRFHNCKKINPELIGTESHINCRNKCDTNKKRCIHDENLKTLADLSPGEEGTISRVTAIGAIRQRLLDMGMLPQTKVSLERLAPSGDPLWIQTEGFQLSLRLNEARAILLENS